jgi:hypothetical protein
MESREEIIREIQWGRGTPFCDMGTFISWATDTPSSTHPDIGSVVMVHGPPEKYTDEEPGKILEFSRKQTEYYDKLFSYRRGANLYVIDKIDEGKWLRMQQSWKIGPFFSETLDEAISFVKNY